MKALEEIKLKDAISLITKYENDKTIIDMPADAICILC